MKQDFGSQEIAVEQKYQAKIRADSRQEGVNEVELENGAENLKVEQWKAQ